MKPKRDAANVVAAKEAEEALRKEAPPWERTFDSIPDLIAILDCDHRIVRVNRAMAERLGRTPRQCAGLKCYETICGSSQPPTYCPHVLSLADGKQHAAEQQESRLGGHFLVSTTPLRDEAGRIVGSVHVARDIGQQKKIQETLRHLLEASDHERQLISCDIHDGLAQQLAAALMQFEAFACLQDKDPEQAAKAHALGVQLVREGHAEARRLIEGLRPPQLREGGIVSAIEDLVRQSNRRSPVKIEFSSNVVELGLAPMLENTVFRIVQECVNNACRHSKSKKVKIELTRHDDELRVEVQDWGVGFEVGRIEEGHFGLEGIQERARVFGGRAIIRSRPRHGTDIIVELPLPPVAAGPHA
jgi:PAS domain S-box-containing protein